jgi:hypothetical protein
MDLIYKALEKLLSSLMLSFVLFVASFSYMTGHFPPKKDDLSKMWTLGKGILLGSPEFNEKSQALQAEANPSIQQILEYQKLALKRTEMTVELKNIFSRIPNQTGSPEVAAKLMKLQEQFSAVETSMNELGTNLQKSTETK